jgi:hypothetical protein
MARGLTNDQLAELALALQMEPRTLVLDSTQDAGVHPQAPPLSFTLEFEEGAKTWRMLFSDGRAFSIHGKRLYSFSKFAWVPLDHFGMLPMPMRQHDWVALLSRVLRTMDDST